MTPDYSLHWYTFLICLLPIAARVDMDKDGWEARAINHWTHTWTTVAITVFLMVPLHWLEPQVKFWWIQFPVYIWLVFFAPWFDFAVNFAHGVPIAFIGTTSIWDKFRAYAPRYAVTFVRLWMIGVGITVMFFMSYII